MQLVKTTLNQLDHMGHPGQAAVKVDFKVADGVDWEDIRITKGKGTTVKKVATPESGAP